jgi:hypothetical protein
MTDAAAQDWWHLHAAQQLLLLPPQLLLYRQQYCLISLVHRPCACCRACLCLCPSRLL